MKKRFRLGSASVIALILCGTLWIAFHSTEPEPTYQGKPLHVWLKGFDAAQGSAEYSAAATAIQQIGTNALPTLIRYLRRKDPPFYSEWINLKSKLHLLHGEVDYAVFWHRRAAHGCGALHEKAEAAFPALAEAMNDPQAASDVGNGLSRMMPNSVPVLTNILATGNERARSRAADNLITAYSHPEVEEMARIALLNALHDPDRGVRMAAAAAFQFWNTQTESVVTGLTQALHDPDPSVRGNAATSLGNLGSAAKAAVPDLLKLLEDTSPYVSATVGDRVALMVYRIDPAAAKGAEVRPMRASE